MGSSLPLPRPRAHLVLGQQLAPPVGMRDVMEGKAQVVVTVLEEQRLGLLYQVAAQRALQLQHFLLMGQWEGLVTRGPHKPLVWGQTHLI